MEVDTQDDAFFFAFATPQGALAAAGRAWEVLAAGPIRMRMGIHTGTPDLSESAARRRINPCDGAPSSWLPP
jgi:hypothetical protein